MNEYDQALIHGFALGALVTGTLATGLWIVRDWLQGRLRDLPIRSDWPEHPVFPNRGCGSPSAKADAALKRGTELPPACADGEVISKRNDGTQRGRDAEATNATETRTRPSLK